MIGLRPVSRSQCAQTAADDVIRTRKRLFKSIRSRPTLCSAVQTKRTNNCEISLDLHSSPVIFRFNVCFVIASVFCCWPSWCSCVVAHTQFALKRSNIAVMRELDYLMNQAVRVYVCPKYRKMLVWSTQTDGATLEAHTKCETANFFVVFWECSVPGFYWGFY